ncbi:hypothetical protein Atai01_56780 [Amycolatopsis taiwanensis]|uniref:Uncharacterized protein n=1 Tax=Amycolatopsis taiwanensis TaxID=342230 RepID=A0A9W6R4P0_9PSEU|nr:hypothetical protein Atai01_56780 [Amycolatopsis taiwanensis]
MSELGFDADLTKRLQPKQERADRRRDDVVGDAAVAGRPSVLGVRGLLGLQRSVGNAVVGRLVEGNRASESWGTSTRAPAAPRPIIQRADGSGTWNAPEDFGAIADKGAARVALGELLKEVEAYRGTEIGTVAQQTKVIHDALARQRAQLIGEGALTTHEAEQLNGISMAFDGFLNNARSAVVAAVKAGLSGLLNPPDVGEINDAIGEVLHALFVRPDEDKLATAKEYLERTKGISDKAKWVADKAMWLMTDIDQARKIFHISEKLEKFGGLIEELITIKDIGRNLLLLSSRLSGDDSLLGGADAIEAGVDLAGLAGKPLISAVPLFGTYWTDYLVPLTKRCCEILRKVEGIADKINRDRMAQMINWVPVPGGWRPQPTPPELDPKTYLTMEGGRAVFEYLYSTRVGNQPPMTRDVETVIMGHREMLEKATGTEIELEERTWNPLSWFGRRPVDLPGWVAANITTVWMAFYGGAGLGPI